MSSVWETSKTLVNSSRHPTLAIGLATISLITTLGIILFSLYCRTITLNNDALWANLPYNMPLPNVPENNPLTEHKIELGRYLFYDERLSLNSDISCGSCHQQHLAFTNGTAKSSGTTGDLHHLNAMSLANVAYSSSLTWANPLVNSLEHQALLPMFSEQPVEMGWTGITERILNRLNQDSALVELFSLAFPNEKRPVNLKNIVYAIASFERTLLSFQSPYDAYMAGDRAALNASQKRGMALFMSERLECFHCHGGPTFTDSLSHNGQLEKRVAFHNNGLYSYPKTQTFGHNGLAELSLNESDAGRFKAPTLRNIEVTAPYMHDGSVATLEEVIEHYEQGGIAGFDHPQKSIFVRGFILTDEERTDLLNFLMALTDEEFLTNPKFANPYNS